MPILDIAFKIQSLHHLQVDHAYLLYSAISRLLPPAHADDNVFAVHPITGQQVGGRQMALTDRSRLVLRVEDGHIAPFLKLAGSSLRIGGALLQVGVPEIRCLEPAAALRSRLVTIKVSGVSAAELTRELFEVAAKKQLVALGVAAGREVQSGVRRTLRIRQKEVVGYELIVKGLLPEESLLLQSHGVGGRRKLGCGVFSPISDVAAAARAASATVEV